MSNFKNVPKYSLHKPSGQARVIIGGKHHYLGKFGSPESRNKYAALIGQQFHEESGLPDSPPGTFPALTIDELISHYLDHAEKYYCFEGKPTKEYTCMVEAVRHLRPLYGDSEAKDFGPKKLTIVRETMIGQRLARTCHQQSRQPYQTSLQVGGFHRAYSAQCLSSHQNPAV